MQTETGVTKMAKKKETAKKKTTKKTEKPAAKIQPPIIIRTPEVCIFCNAKDRLSTYKTVRHPGFTDRMRKCLACKRIVRQRTNY